MASRSLLDLDAKVRSLAMTFVAECEKAGIDVLIYCTYRSSEEQDSLYRKGRSGAPGPIVTNARGGQSWHNHRRAFDFVPLVHGKAAWENTKLYKTCGEIAEKVGLEWAGRWKGSLRETAHCQYTEGLSITEFKNRGNQ